MGFRIGTLVGLLLLTAWFALKAMTALSAYQALSHSAPAHIERWEVLPQGKNKYVSEAHFSFAENLEATAALQRTYPNVWAAQKGLELLKKNSWRAYYNPKAPEKAKLERHFPLKPLVYAFLVVAIMLYFLLLFKRDKQAP